MREPAYKQIQHHILGEIESGRLLPGAQIPTEMALAEQFSVSRMTVNKAIVGLSNLQILNRIAGKGTFVAQKKGELPLMQIVDFAEEITLRGQEHSMRVLKHDYQAIYDEQAMQLGMLNGAKAGYCEVLHFENTLPLIWESRWVNPAHVRDFMTQDFSLVTPTAYLLKGYPLTEIEHTVEAIAADERVAELLNIPAASPCIQVTRRTWSNDFLISYTRLVSAGNHYKLRSRYCLNSND